MNDVASEQVRDRWAQILNTVIGKDDNPRSLGPDIKGLDLEVRVFAICKWDAVDGDVTPAGER